MINKKCLHCKEEYEAKKDTSKFCSTSCRVMWNRRYNKKAPPITEKMQIKLLINTILDRLDGVKFISVHSEELVNNNVAKVLDPIILDLEGEEKMSVLDYVTERINIDTPEQYKLWEDKLKQDKYLKDWEKKEARIGIL